MKKFRNIIILVDIILLMCILILITKHIVKIEDENKRIREEIKLMKADNRIKYDDIINIIENK